VGGTSLSFSMFIDLVRALFRLTVLIISLSVYLFSCYYVDGIKGYRRFHAILLVFIGSILLLIFRPRIFSLILGWDGLGVSSFFLVIFYKRQKAFNSGLLTGISNRVGDALILVSLTSYLVLRGGIIPLAQTEHIGLRPYIMILLITAACTKRAQLPFSAWLPAAMAAPTPVSALVHSSTLVTAGVYLVTRIINWLSEGHLQGLSLLGAFTITMARLSAILETDGKKIVALSTLSQLGVMMCGVATNNATVVIFHLLVHAFFKALLFIATGVVIHSSGGSQDLRGMGGLGGLIPLTKGVVIFTKLSLMGLPFFAAFYSKEIILERIRRGATALFLRYALIVCGVGFTVMYSGRYIVSVIALSSRGAVALYTGESVFFLYLRVLGLTFPRVLSGSVLYIILAEYINSPLLSIISKLRILGGMAAVILRGGIISRKGPVAAGKYFSFMWGLAAAVGGPALRAAASVGAGLMSVLNFSVWDYLVFL